MLPKAKLSQSASMDSSTLDFINYYLKKQKKEDRLIAFIRNSIIGKDACFRGPFGFRRITYADYTASGKSLTFIEDFIQNTVQPYYANTHTEASFTGRQTNHFREESRKLIHKSVNGGSNDVVIFCGSGVTGAIEKIIEVMNLRIPKDLDKQYQLSDKIPKDHRPVVFVGPYEHHSNEISWVETIAEVVQIAMDEDGGISMADLEKQLQTYKDRKVKIGSFSAASNVTGTLTDTIAVSKLLHKHGALAFFDYASAGPYVTVDMNPTMGTQEDAKLQYKDAVFFSPHKFIGGPGTPGVLIAKKSLFKNTVPSVPGGGTVLYVVSHKDFAYLDEIEAREEGGTPAILESIRAGLVFQLKDAVTSSVIFDHEHRYVTAAIDTWKKNPNIQILGNLDKPRLSIVSFLITHNKKILHHNFVTSLLNDLFGIQARGGCSCAGPYGIELLKASKHVLDGMKKKLALQITAYKPGWTRVNFNYFISQKSVDYIIKCIDFVATHGWKFMTLYKFNMETGQWKFNPELKVIKDDLKMDTIMSLNSISYETGFFESPSMVVSLPESVLSSHMAESFKILNKIIKKFKLKPEKFDQFFPSSSISSETEPWELLFPAQAWADLKAGELDQLLYKERKVELQGSMFFAPLKEVSIQKRLYGMRHSHSFEEYKNAKDIPCDAFVQGLQKHGFTMQQALELFVDITHGSARLTFAQFEDYLEANYLF